MNSFKRRNLIILILLILIVPLLRWVVYPWVDKIPSDFNYDANIFSIDNFYNEKLLQYSGEQLSVTEFGYDVEKKVGSKLLIKNYFDVRKPSGEKIFKVERIYGINPKDGSHIPEIGDQQRTGFLFAPKDVQKNDSFYYWHVNYNTPALMKFHSEEEITGLKTYKFISNFKADQTKNLGHLPGVPEERGVELDVLLETWIDPETGWLIKYEDHTTAWFYDIKTGKRLFPWNKFHNEFTRSSILHHVEIARSKQFIRNLLTIYIPLLSLLICLVILINNYSSRIIKKEYRPHYFFVLISSIGIIISFILFNYLNNSNKEKQILSFENEATKILSYVNDEFQEVQNEVSKLRMDLKVIDTKYPEYQWFKDEVSPLLNEIASIDAISYIPLVKENEREACEHFAKSQGEQDFQIHYLSNNKVITSSGKKEYFPVLYTAPYEINKHIIGYDLGSDSVRKKTFDLSRKTGEFTMSAPIEIVRQQPEHGIVIYLPVYKNQDAENREVTGFFATVFGTEKLIRTAKNSHDVNRKIGLKVRDITESSNSSGLFDDEIEFSKKMKIITKDLPVLNRNWEFTFYLQTERGDFTTLAILISGILISLITAYLIFRMQSDNSKELSMQVNQLEKTKGFLLEAQEVGKVGSWELDYTTGIFNASREFFKIIGREELSKDIFTIDQWRTFIHPDDLLFARETVVKSIENKKPYDIEIRIIKPSEENIYVWLNGKPYYNENGEIERVTGTIVDISDRKKVVAELLKAKKQTEETALLKETFLANMSHEIRTPINAIVGFTDLLLRRDIPSLEKDYLRTIRFSGENLLNIINDILDVSKIESGAMTFESLPCNLSEMFKSLSKVFSPKAKEKHNKLVFELDPEIPQTILCDPTRLTQILNNLISNALKFTQDGKVKVSTKFRKTNQDVFQISFLVEDNGIGIEADKLPHVFERFRQADTHITRFYGGTGLGLNIAKQLIEKQGGSIKIESEVNKGTAITFVLPFLKSDIELNSINKEESRINLDSFSSINILLVEDNQVNIKLLQSLFDEYHLKLDIALNGKEAVEKVRNGNYDVVLMDLEMPVMNGFEATKIIRQELQSKVKIIAVTAHSIVGEKEKCLVAGMDDYLSKPIHASILFEKIFDDFQSASTNENEIYSQGIDFTYVYETANKRKDIVLELLEVFKEQLEKDLEFIHAAILKKDFSSLKRRAHNMKSTIAIFGLSELKVQLEKLEEDQTKSLTSEELEIYFIRIKEFTDNALEAANNELLKLKKK